MQEIGGIFVLLTGKATFKCTVWEDNDSCISAANYPKFTNRTKHIDIKYHHFKSCVSGVKILSLN